MRLATVPLLALLALAAAPASFAQDAPEPPAAAGEAPLPRTAHAREIRSLIRALGSEDWAAREAARERLLEIGPEATPWLERATRDPDAQRAAIAQELVRTLRWVVPADVRQSIGDVLDDFPALSHERRLEALARVGQLGPQARAASPFLINVARFDPDAEVRHQAVLVYLELTAGDVPDQDRAALDALADERSPGPLTFVLRARLLDRLGRKADAIAAARQAWSLRREDAPLACFLIDLLLAADDLEAALQVAAEAEALHPQDAGVRIRAGEVLVLSGREAEGLERLRSVVESEAILQYQGLLLRLGQAYLRCKRVDEAEKVFRTALGRFPYNRELNVAMADVLRAGGRVEEAVQVYLSEFRYATPGTTGYETIKARLRELLLAGGATWLAEVDAFYDDAHLGRPVVAVRRAVAQWLRARNLLEEAVAELLAACALSPSSAALRLELGDVRRDAGDLAGARAAYEQALRLDPKSIAGARLRDLGGLEAARTAREGGGEPAGFRSWEWRITSADLERTGEAVTADAAPPPLVLREQVLVPAAGSVDVFGLSAEDGALLWRFSPEKPPAEEGTLPEQLGLELLALVEAPAALLAATDPRRAREGKPLAVALYNAYWRSTSRSWRAARFTGLHAYLLDPQTGKALGRRTVDDDAQVIAPWPVARRGRVLAFASPRAKRVVLEQLDLVVGRVLWQTGLPYVAMRRPLYLDDGVVVAWDSGVVALDREGKKRWGFELGADPARPEDPAGDGPGPAAATLTTDVAPCGSGVVVGTSDGRLLRLALQDGAKAELARLGGARLTGDVLVHGQRAFAAERGGRVHALDLDAGLAAVTSRAWTLDGPRAAARSLTWAGDLIFALNGSDDAFADEVPAVLAIDPASGQVLLQRPVDRPATLSTGHGLIVIASGGRSSRLGLRAVAIRPRERLDPRRAKLTVLETAARDALFEGQFEVSAVLARRYVVAAGGYDVLDAPALAFVAQTLARSNRPDEALDVINLGEERAGSDAKAQEAWGALRKELKLEEPPPPDKKPGAAPQGPQDPAPPQPPAPTEKPPAPPGG